MTTVPIAILVVFLMILAGGPKAFLLEINDVLRTFSEWVMVAFS
jgi:hypothetical protein